MSITRLTIDADLCLMSFEAAWDLLPPSYTQAILVVGEPLRDVAEYIGREKHMVPLILPEAMMANQHAWAIVDGSEAVYSVPPP
jgi:hypothetical protein